MSFVNKQLEDIRGYCEFLEKSRENNLKTIQDLKSQLEKLVNNKDDDVVNYWREKYEELLKERERSFVLTEEEVQEIEIKPYMTYEFVPTELGTFLTVKHKGKVVYDRKNI